MGKTDVADCVKKNPVIRYFAGRRFVRDDDGKFVAAGSFPGMGKYGYETRTMRIPLPLVPFVKMMLKKCEEIESLRRNLATNIFNTSPDFHLLETLEKPILQETLDGKEILVD